MAYEHTELPIGLGIGRSNSLDAYAVWSRGLTEVHNTLAGTDELTVIVDVRVTKNIPANTINTPQSVDDNLDDQIKTWNQQTLKKSLFRSSRSRHGVFLALGGRPFVSHNQSQTNPIDVQTHHEHHTPPQNYPNGWAEGVSHGLG